MNHIASNFALSSNGAAPEFGFDSGVRDSRILVVDDQQPIRKILQAYLTAGGYRNLSFAQDGDEALEAIRRESPDLVILDLLMPHADGLEVCAALRADAACADLPVLVQTAADSPEERTRVFAAGATDMIGKPINSAELLARVGIHLQNRYMLRRLSEYHDRMERELDEARRMQHDIMPRLDEIDRIRDDYGIGIRSLLQTCDQLGGDFWNVWPVGPRRLGFWLVDFAGHGVTASLNTFRFQSLALGLDLGDLGVSAHAEALNRRLESILTVGQFATAIVGCIDLDDDVIRYAAAGAPEPLLQTPDAPSGRFCATAGRPLGIAHDSRYPEQEIPFPPGSSLFLYSDSLVETPSMAHPVYDADRIRAVLTCPTGAESGFDVLVGDFFTRLTGPLKDDLTLLLISRETGA